MWGLLCIGLLIAVRLGLYYCLWMHSSHVECSFNHLKPYNSCSRVFPVKFVYILSPVPSSWWKKLSYMQWSYWLWHTLIFNRTINNTHISIYIILSLTNCSKGTKSDYRKHYYHTLMQFSFLSQTEIKKPS